MRDKLCVSERRTKILEFLVQKKQSTRCELATEFNVSTDTIDRDIVYLSGIAPVYTKQGNQGGVYILPEYRSYKNYLTDEEEEHRRQRCSIIKSKRIHSNMEEPYT